MWWEDGSHLLEPYLILFCYFPLSFPLELLGLGWELHREILWEGRMIGRKLDLVWTFMVCIDDLTWFLKACLSSSWFSFLVISEPFLGDFLGVFSWPFSWGFGGGCMHEPFVVLFPLIPLPYPWAKGLDFGVFVLLGFVVFLEEILRFLLIQRVLVDHNLGMECPWGVPTTPKVLCESVE
jgi:hypothetical protein